MKLLEQEKTLRKERTLSPNKRGKMADNASMPKINYDKAGPSWGFGS